MSRWKPSLALTAGVLAGALLIQACGDDGGDSPSGPPASYTLTVTLAGIGTGTVTSSPAGIDCKADGGTCAASYDEGTQVTLTATPGQGMQFTGWSGDGSGTTTRTVTMDRNRAVSASFDDPDKAVQQIGSQGGTVASRDGDVTLSVPPGALSSATEITIETIDPEDLGDEWEDVRSLGQIDAAYDFGPDGLTFAVPARVTFGPQQVEQAGDTTRFSVTSIFTSHEGGVVPLDSLQVEVDLDAGTAVTTGKVSHFSPIVEVLYGKQAEKMFADFSRPEVVEVGEEFDVSLKIYLAEKLSLRLRPHEVIEQVRYTDVESVADRVAYLWLRCMAPGVQTYSVLATNVPSGRPDVELRYLIINLRVLCKPPSRPTPRFHQLTLEYLKAIEGMFHVSKKSRSILGGESVQSAPARGVGGPGAAGLVASMAGADEAPEECPLIMVAGTGGAALVDPCDGTVRKEYPVVGSENYEVLVLPAPMEDRHVMLLTGVGARDCSLFDNGDRGMCVLRSGTFPDALPISADDPGAGAIVVRYPGTGSQIEFMRFRPDWGSFQWLPTFVSIPALDGAGRIRSAVAGGPAEDEFTPPDHILAVAAMDEGPAKLFHIDLSGDERQITEVGELEGSDPRRLRCDLESGMCAVSDFSGSRITILRWDGSSAPSITDATAEGAIAKGPVGIDVFGRRIVSAGFDDNRYSILEVDEAGKIVSVTTKDLPEGCTKPGHAKFLRDAKNTVVVSCWESTGIAVIPEAF